MPEPVYVSAAAGGVSVWLEYESGVCMQADRLLGWANATRTVAEWLPGHVYVGVIGEPVGFAVQVVVTGNLD